MAIDAVAVEDTQHYSDSCLANPGVSQVLFCMTNGNFKAVEVLDLWLVGEMRLIPNNFAWINAGIRARLWRKFGKRSSCNQYITGFIVSSKPG
jgi:hypothetical protein